VIRQTTILAYDHIKKEGFAERQNIMILNLLRSVEGGLTRQEVSDLLGLRLCAVCGRIKELMKEGAVFEDGTRINPSTGRRNLVIKYWRCS